MLAERIERMLGCCDVSSLGKEDRERAVMYLCPRIRQHAAALSSATTEDMEDDADGLEFHAERYVLLTQLKNAIFLSDPEIAAEFTASSEEPCS